MSKAPYTKQFTQRNNPHVDTCVRTINYKNGSTYIDINTVSPVNNITLSHMHTSISTKPWPNGVPPRWTTQTRDHWRETADWAQGQVIWTPGVQWPDVQTRSWKNQGGWGTVFTRHEDAFWSVAPNEKPSQDDLDNKIRLKLLDPWNAATMMAEMSRTVDGVAERLLKLAEAARALRRGDLKRARAALGYSGTGRSPSAKRRRSLEREIDDPIRRGLANDWLELQYGWLPLLSDIKGMIDHAKGHPPKIFLKASSTSHIDRTRTYLKMSQIDGGRCKNVDTIKGSCRRSWTIEVRASNDYVQRLNSVGLLNPLGVAWELVPFSFVVDWFLPVGDFLNSASATLGTEIVGTCFTERLDYQTFTASSLVPATAADQASGSGERGHAYHKYTRSSPPFPPARLPSFKNPLSVTHAANALALLTQSFKR